MNKVLKKDTLMAIKYLAEQHSDEFYFDSYAGDWLDIIYSAGRTEAIKEIMDIQEIEYQKANDDNFRGGIAHVINIIKKKKR